MPLVSIPPGARGARAVLTPVSPPDLSPRAQLQHLSDTKARFTESDVVTILVEIVAEAISLHDAYRNEKHGQIVELSLALFRNLLAIRDAAAGKNTLVGGNSRMAGWPLLHTRQWSTVMARTNLSAPGSPCRGSCVVPCFQWGTWSGVGMLVALLAMMLFSF